jgi:SAM-dependent methyltransferase
MRRLTTVHTGLQKIDVWAAGRDGDPREVEFRVAGATHAWWHQHRFLTGLAWDNLCAACLLRPGGPPRSVLMLGLAGGTSLRALRHLAPEVRLEAVDYDAGIVALAQQHMKLDALGITVHHGDAYEFVRRDRGLRYDVIVDDVYQALDHDVARPGAWSAETLGALRRLMAPGGLLVVNLVTGAGHRSMQSDFRRVFRETFPVVRSVTTPAGLNEALVGGEAVRGGGALGVWRAGFSTREDREYWDRLRVRRL